MHSIKMSKKNCIGKILYFNRKWNPEYLVLTTKCCLCLVVMVPVSLSIEDGVYFVPLPPEFCFPSIFEM